MRHPLPQQQPVTQMQPLPSVINHNPVNGAAPFYRQGPRQRPPRFNSGYWYSMYQEEVIQGVRALHW